MNVREAWEQRRSDRRVAFVCNECLTRDRRSREVGVMHHTPAGLILRTETPLPMRRSDIAADKAAGAGHVKPSVAVRFVAIDTLEHDAPVELTCPRNHQRVATARWFQVIADSEPDLRTKRRGSAVQPV
jgi:hypothetical protein